MLEGGEADVHARVAALDAAVEALGLEARDAGATNRNEQVLTKPLHAPN